MNHKIPMDGVWQQFSDPELDVLRADGCGNFVDLVGRRSQLMEENPLACFLAHGVKWRSDDVKVGDTDFVIPASGYPREMGNDGIAFQNDWTSDMSIVLAPNQVGKTYGLAAWTGFRILPTEDHWPCFAENGLEHHEWDGPKKWVVASWSWDNVATIWERIRDVFPRHELGEFAPGGRKSLTFGDGRRKTLHLGCGSEIRFLCYTQMQMHWEGFECDGGSFDEQIPKEKYTGWVRGTTTRGDYTPAGFALTGHVLGDRPDTGSAGWIKRDLWDGENLGGNKVVFYHLSVDSTPAAIIGNNKKKKLYDRWVNPESRRSRKEEREAVARYWGGFEEGSGMVFDSDVWQRNIHVISPLWPDDKIPADLTKWRVLDYGSNKGINVCSWFAVDPRGISFLYRLIYERGLEIADFAKLIIDMSHNTREMVGQERDEGSGNTYESWEEKYSGESYWGGTILDPRSAAQSQQGQTLEQIFYRYGLRDIRAGCGQRDDIQIPRLKDVMRIDWTRDHIVTGEKGCPSMMVFEGCHNAVREIEGARLPEDGRVGMINSKDAQHFLDTAKYYTSDTPAYMGDSWIRAEPAVERDGNLITGY